MSPLIVHRCDSFGLDKWKMGPSIFDTTGRVGRQPLLLALRDVLRSRTFFRLGSNATLIPMHCMLYFIIFGYIKFENKKFMKMMPGNLLPVVL